MQICLSFQALDGNTYIFLVEKRYLVVDTRVNGIGVLLTFLLEMKNERRQLKGF